MLVNGWSLLGLFGGVSTGLQLVFHVDGFWAFVAAVLAAVGFPWWVIGRFSAWPDDELRGRPIVSRVVSKREQWRSDVMKRSWWVVGLNIALPKACLIDVVMDPAPSVTFQNVLLLLLIGWCLIGYTDLVTKTWRRSVTVGLTT